MITKHDFNHLCLSVGLISNPVWDNFLNNFFPFMSHVGSVCGAIIGVVTVTNLLKRWLTGDKK